MVRNSSKLKLPLTITLTAQGEFFFCQHESSMDTKEDGIIRKSHQLSCKSCSAGLLKRMITSGYISQIEVTRTDFNSKREEIIDLAKLISYGILQHKCTFKLADKLNRTNFVNQWNRHNPLKMLTSDNIAENFYSRKKQTPTELASTNSAMRRLLINCFDSHEAKRKNIRKEDMKLLLFKAKNYLGYFNSQLWVLMMKIWNTPNCKDAVETVNAVLWEYLSKSDIADYLGLLAMELVLVVEKALILKATTTYLEGKIELEHFMRNSNDRAKLFKSLQRRNETASLIWRIKGMNSQNRASNTLNLIVANRIGESESVLKSLGNSSIKPKSKNIAEFYKDIGSEENKIGLYYLNYIEEECRRLGVKLSTYTSIEKERNIFSVNLSVRF